MDVVGDLRRGEDRALGLLFDRYFTPLCYFATGFVQDSEEAKDIVLITFNKLWKSRAKFYSEEAIKSFLYISTKNLCLDRIKTKRRRLARDRAFSGAESMTEDDFQRRLLESELLSKIYDEAVNLPEKCRKVFELTYLDGLTTAEIAERLDTSVSNVTSQRHRAIQLLKLFFLDKF